MKQLPQPQRNSLTPGLDIQGQHIELSCQLRDQEILSTRLVTIILAKSCERTL